jgi:hypothetical protein
MVSQGGGKAPRWRKDGKELFYVMSGGQVMSVKVNANGSAFQSSTPELLFKAPLVQTGVFDVNADGTQFVFPSLVR